MLWAALLTIILIWSAAIVWGAWRARWITTASFGLMATLTVILAMQTIGGPQPVGYGIALSVSIFLAGVMTMMGLIVLGVRLIAKLR